MSRKHFRLIADAIRQIEDSTARRDAAEKLASVCAQSNPRFQHSTFMKACNVR